MLTNFLTALHFLTIIRTKRARPFDATVCGRSAGFFPLIGLLLGALVWGVDWLLRPVLPTILLSILLVGLLAVVSRGVHLDGVVKSTDALFGGLGPSEENVCAWTAWRLGPFFPPRVQSMCLEYAPRRLSRYRALSRTYAGSVGVRGDGL